MKLSIGFITARENFEPQWFLDSLAPQLRGDDGIEVIFVTLHQPEWELNPEFYHNRMTIKYVEPKPNIWSGKHRLPKDNWWSKSNSANTFLCMAKHPWVCFLDDRCVLTSTWLQSIREAMEGNYIVAGAYEKRINMTVKNGVIKNSGETIGKDCREPQANGQVIKCPGEWLFGCCLAMPLEWLLKVNGYPEKRCDSMSFEDVILGLILQNNKFPMKYDPRMKIIEDRTPDKLGEPMKRTAKERHPNDTQDKAHKVLEWVRAGAEYSDNGYQIEDLRKEIQAGKPFPLQKEGEHYDWFDNQAVSTF